MKFYHISHDFLGNRVKLKPRVPRNRSEETFHHKLIKENEYHNREIGEDDQIKRICVSNTIAGALIARGCDYSHFHVYQAQETYAISRDLPLLLVPDAKITGERWLLTPTIFDYIGEIYCSHHNYDCADWKWVEKVK